MNQTKEKLESFIKLNLFENRIYSEIFDVVKNNSEGRVWLIGGVVYKILINELYGSNLESKDWDFVVEKIKKPLNLLSDWEVGESRLGSPKIKKGGIVVDLVPLDNVHSIKQRKLEPKIEHFLSGVPLTTHSLAYDIDSGELLGQTGIQSVLTKTVGINNKSEFDFSQSIYGTSYTVKNFAEVLGFSYESPHKKV